MKYEYLFELVRTDKFVEVLNEYGKQGWRVSQLGSHTGLKREVLFERELKK